MIDDGTRRIDAGSDSRHPFCQQEVLASQVPAIRKPAGEAHGVASVRAIARGEVTGGYSPPPCMMQIPETPTRKTQDIFGIPDLAAAAHEHGTSHAQHGRIVVERSDQRIQPIVLGLTIIVQKGDDLARRFGQAYVPGVRKAASLGWEVHVVHVGKVARLGRFFDDNDLHSLSGISGRTHRGNGTQEIRRAIFGADHHGDRQRPGVG
jgi:hypothetical protein